MDHYQTIELKSDEITIRLIATGVIQMSERVQNGDGMFPYPLPLQRGFDRLIVATHRANQSAPEHISMLLNWCEHKPLMQWGLELEGLGDHDTLLIAGQPSSLCDEWACTASDVEAELMQQHIMKHVFRICHDLNADETYRRFRQLLIEKPVLTALELQRYLIQPDLIPLREPLSAAYQVASKGWTVQNEFVCCRRCDNLLVPLLNQTLQCENPHCQRLPLQIGRRIPVHEQPLWLTRGLRRFVAIPGRAELRLAAQLRDAGIHVELWPQLDRYDLRITFADGHVWAVDVKDWQNPFLLGRRVTAFANEPAWQRAFFVFPRERKRIDYVRAFKASCSVLTNTTDALMEDDFMKLAISEQRERLCV